jgi:hypothetical protein
MPNVPQAAKENASTGWLVQAGQHYYTGDVHNPLVTWSPFPKFAKVYKHQKRAQKAALRLGGQVVPVGSSAFLLNG